MTIRYLLAVILFFALLLGHMPTVLGSSDPGQAAWVNVRDYGALGDGATDDTASIQAAIDDAHARGVPTVVIPAGHYMVDSAGKTAAAALRVRSNLTIEIQSGATVELFPNDQRSHRMFYVLQCENVTFQGGGTLVGERYGHLGTSGEWGMGIDVRSSHNVTIKDLEIKEFWGDSIYVGGGATMTTGYSTNILIQNVNAHSSRRQGISVTSWVDGIIIEDCTIHNIYGTNPQSGIDIETNDPEMPVRNVIIRNNTFFDNVRCDILIGAEAKHVYIHGNTSLTGATRNAEYGIRAYHGKNVHIFNNKIEARELGIQVRYNQGVKIYNNTITGQSRNGEYIGMGINLERQATNVSIRDNTLTRLDTGIFYDGNTDVTIERNHIQAIQRQGIRAWGHSYNITHQENIIENVIDGYGIYARGDGIKITGNTLEDINGPSIFIHTGDGVVISKNQLVNLVWGQNPEFIEIDKFPAGVQILSNTFESPDRDKYAVTVSPALNEKVTIKHNIALYSRDPFNVSSLHIVRDNTYKGTESNRSLRLASGL